MRPPTEKTIQRDQAEKAAEVFGLSLDDLDESSVVGAFRLMVRTAHPDTGAKPDEAATLISNARGARTILLRWLDEQPDATCEYPGCFGSGWVSAGYGHIRPCPHCGG